MLFFYNISVSFFLVVFFLLINENQKKYLAGITDAAKKQTSLKIIIQNRSSYTQSVLLLSVLNKCIIAKFD